jgi:hypothetical protein
MGRVVLFIQVLESYKIKYTLCKIRYVNYKLIFLFIIY